MNLILLVRKVGALDYSLCVFGHLQKEAEKRLALSQKGHGEYREVNAAPQSLFLSILRAGSLHLPFLFFFLFSFHRQCATYGSVLLCHSSDVPS